MFSLPPHRPSLGSCTRALPLHASSPRQLHSFDDNNPTVRPSLKRQSTAPNAALFSHRVKKLRGDEIREESWTDDVHQAFLEALQNHPNINERKDGDSAEPSVEDQADYCTIIQDYILKKTGRPHSYDDIQEHLFDALASLNVSSPATDICNAQDPLPSGDNHLSASPQGGREEHIILSSNPVAGVVDDSSTPSMSRRRQACDRPTLNLRVKIPTSAFSPAHLGPPTSGTTPITPSFFIAANHMSPVTPIEKLSEAPREPPEIPRMIDMRRNMAGRWMPTPTEGVIPLASRSGNTSPASSEASENSSDSSGATSTRSSATEAPESYKRPKAAPRSLSWLSIPKRRLADTDSDSLASPFTSDLPAPP